LISGGFPEIWTPHDFNPALEVRKRKSRVRLATAGEFVAEAGDPSDLMPTDVRLTGERRKTKVAPPGTAFLKRKFWDFCFTRSLKVTG